MSAGKFEVYNYETDAGDVGQIRLQPETIGLTLAGTVNAPAAGAVNLPLRVRARKGTREYGIGSRSVSLRFTATIPTGYSGDDVQVPVLTPAAFASYNLGSAGTYLGEAVVVIGRKSEAIR